MFYHVAFMREIDGRQRDIFFSYIIPYIQFCPIADWKYSYILTFVYPAVVGTPQLGSLQFWVPLAKFIFNQKYSLFCSRFLFVSSCAADTGVKSKFFYGV